MNEPEIYARLTALHSALVEKLGGQPYFEPDLKLSSSGWAHIMLWNHGNCANSLYTAKAETISAALDDADRFIAAMPDPEAAKLTAWHGKLADVIDEGHELNLPDDVMTPLRQSSQAMTENLLTHAAE